MTVRGMNAAEDLDEEVAVLGRVPLFHSIDPAKLKLLAFTSARVRFAPDDVIFSAGEPGDAAYVILSGTAGVYIEGEDGMREVAKAGTHEVVGEIAVLCDVPRTATVKALTELVALRITKDMFLQMIAEFPDMAIEIMRHLARRLEETTDRLRRAGL